MSPNQALGPALRVMTASIDTSYDFTGYNNHNIFNKLSDDSEYGFYYFPYGYLFRYPKWGRINSLGFRMQYELEWYKQNRSGIYLVEFFGGSTGFDILVPDHETIAHKIEIFLNENRANLGIDKPVHVINMSAPGNVLLNQINTFTLFGYQLEPDMVISHHGANDVITGLITDPTLLNNYMITYPDVQETWAKAIHDSTHDVNYDFAEPTAPDFKAVQLQCYPHKVAEAYATRVAQFRHYVEGLHIKFVSGFQPICTSKLQLNSIEYKNIDGYNPYYKQNYDASKYTYEIADKLFAQSEESIAGFANIHRHFSNLPSDIVHFGDHHHLTAEGDTEAALCYTKAIETLFK